MKHKCGSLWHCLLWGGRLPRDLPSSAHLVLAVFAGSRPAQGAASQCSHTEKVSGCGGSCCCTRPCPEHSPSLPPALSDPAAKENCMMHLLRSLPDPNLITFLFLLEHLKR